MFFNRFYPKSNWSTKHFFVWPQSGAARRPRSQRLRNQLYYIKVDFGASHFEAALQLQIEAKRKMLGISAAFEVKSVEKHLRRQNFFNWRPLVVRLLWIGRSRSSLLVCFLFLQLRIGCLVFIVNQCYQPFTTHKPVWPGYHVRLSIKISCSMDLDSPKV